MCVLKKLSVIYCCLTRYFSNMALNRMRSFIQFIFPGFQSWVDICTYGCFLVPFCFSLSGAIISYFSTIISQTNIESNAIVEVATANSLSISSAMTWDTLFSGSLQADVLSSQATITSLISNSANKGQKVGIYGATAQDVVSVNFALHQDNSSTIVPFEIHTVYNPRRLSALKDVRINPGGLCVDVTKAPGDTTTNIIFAKILKNTTLSKGDYYCNIIIKNYAN